MIVQLNSSIIGTNHVIIKRYIIRLYLARRDGMNILVIGGSLFLGKAFVKTARVHKITIYNRGSHPLEITGVMEIYGDRHNEKDLQNLTDSYDVVVDFCAYKSGDISQIVEALKGRFKKYVFVSTVDVLVHGSGNILTEDSPYETRNFGDEAGEYISGKVALEQELLLRAKKNNFNYTILRPAIIYGPENYAPREQIFYNWIEKANQILMPSDATGHFQMVYVEDVAKALLAICERTDTNNQIFNMCGDEIQTYDSFVEALELGIEHKFQKVSIPVADINERGISLPFPLTNEESETYFGRGGALIDGFTDLKNGLREGYIAYVDEHCFEQIDTLFDQNKPKAAEEYMKTALANALKGKRYEQCLKLYNELIGYYRQTSEREELLKTIDNTLKLLEKMDDHTSVSYGTSVLNIANGYRSLGELSSAMTWYEIAQKTYKQAITDGRLKELDLRVAGLYNNLSLLHQELLDYKKAEQCLKKALDIVTALEEGFEIAVTYANLANTLLLAKEYDQAMAYARIAIRRFQARGLKDPHYCAALSALASCFYEQGKTGLAKSIFLEAAQIVESTIGRNKQYERLRESIEMCNKELGNQGISGLELSRRYYEAYGAPMIHEQFAEYETKIAVGLVGEGSECYGFDDSLSTDHDFGPEFCMWLDDETYDAIAEKLQVAYDNLPTQFLGYSRSTTAMGQGRRGVMRIKDFYEKHLHTSSYEEIDFEEIQDYELAVCVNGQVFRDDEGSFTKLRNLLKRGYPEKIRLKKLAQDVAGFSQTGQYNYKRMMDREDTVTANLMIGDFAKHAMKLYHHMNNVFPPHDKWLRKSTASLGAPENVEGNLVVVGGIEQVYSKILMGDSPEEIVSVIDSLGEYFAKELYQLGDISDTDFYLDHHIGELMFKAAVAELSIEDLVSKIVRLEFEAFDKVQNEGGRASCQNNWPTFSVMRKSQYMIWTRQMLTQYLYDFTREYEQGHNLITEKYGRMMESTAPERYEEIRQYFPELSETKKAVIEQIVGIQMNMLEEFGREYPLLAGNARSFHTYEDNPMNTSYETYLRGEISTYSDKMLQLYGGFVVSCAQGGRNIAKEIIAGTGRLYGYEDLDSFEASVKVE